MPLSTARVSGPWDADRIAAFLDAAIIPIRLATVSPSGWPIVLSLWFVRSDDVLLCATQRSASVVQALETSGRCAFEVAGEGMPYHGVRGRAEVTVAPDEGHETLKALLRRYLGGTDGGFARRLLARTSPEVVLRLDPVELSSWDYRARMAGA